MKGAKPPTKILDLISLELALSTLTVLKCAKKIGLTMTLQSDFGAKMADILMFSCVLFDAQALDPVMHSKSKNLARASRQGVLGDSNGTFLFHVAKGSWEDHLTGLKEVFGRLQQAGLKIVNAAQEIKFWRTQNGALARLQHCTHGCSTCCQEGASNPGYQTAQNPQTIARIHWRHGPAQGESR
jgi:hypothetical protein